MGKRISIFIIAVIILSFLIAAYSYYSISEEIIAAHWNAQGEANGYMSKFWGLFLIPLISVGLYFLFLAIPLIDPLKKNINKFQKYYDWLVLVIVLFFFYIFILTVLWNFGYRYNMSVAIIPAVGFLFIYLGFIMKNIKRNWFVGIRTPWTLSNKTVWDRTHILGGKLFTLSGIIMLIGVFFEEYLFWFLFAPIIITVIWTIVYSYLQYRKLK